MTVYMRFPQGKLKALTLSYDDGVRQDIWYATNIEIYEYIQAYNNLQFGLSCDRVYNPSTIPVWLECNRTLFCVQPGGHICIA